MPRKPEPSFLLKLIIWDIAATAGMDNFAAVYRELDRRLEELRKEDQLFEDTPDQRKVRDIIELDIQRLTPEVVVAKLPRHVWHLRNDYEAIKQLAESAKARQETLKEQQEDPSNSLTIWVREAVGTAVDLESGKAGRLIAFTLGNRSKNVLTVERICLEVLSCQSYDELPHIEARVIPLKYDVKLSPDRLGEYVVTEEKFRYEGPGADDFDLVCDSPPGFKYNVRLNIYYSALATKKHLTLSSDTFDIYFYKEGSLLSRYIHKGHARRFSQRDKGSIAKK